VLGIWPARSVSGFEKGGKSEAEKKKPLKILINESRDKNMKELKKDKR
jgi:hypothetical protein